MNLFAGYAQVVITPSLERTVYLAGFEQNRRAESVHDDLYARALALRSGQTTLVLASLDLVGFFRHDVQEVIRKVQKMHPSVHVIIASTHTHHGPDTMGLWGPDTSHSGVDRNYIELVQQKLATTILEAIDLLQPVSFRTACVQVPGLAKNSRNPEILDNELTLAQFNDAESGKAIISLFNFPCHPEVLWQGNTQISADYPGVLRREVEKATGGACIFFSGALGGMMTPDVVNHSFAEAEHMGSTLAQTGLQALEKSGQGVWSPEVSLQKQEIRVSLTNILFKLAFWKKLLPDTRDKRSQILTEVNLIKIGPLWLATIPGELLPRLGLELKTKMRQAGAEIAGILSLANDELGYILPKEEYRYPLNPFKPGKHYEETMSIGKEMGPAVVGALNGLIG